MTISHVGHFRLVMPLGLSVLAPLTISHVGHVRLVSMRLLCRSGRWPPVRVEKIAQTPCFFIVQTHHCFIVIKYMCMYTKCNVTVQQTNLGTDVSPA